MASVADGTASSVSYGDARRAWSPEFIAYMNMIVDHPNYAGIPGARDDHGKIDWTIPSNRPQGSKNWNGNALRREWWRQRATSLGIEQQGDWLSKTARAIHPTGQKPCQVCGRVMSLAYRYPTRQTIARLNAALPPESAIDPWAFLSINAVIDQLVDADAAEALDALSRSFPELRTAGGLDEVRSRVENMVAAQSRRFSPGSMSNAPDRLDGFHTYNLCCRARQDTGRTAQNLGSYGVDRRAYEHWCEGNWAAADELMSSVGRGPCLHPNHQGLRVEVQLTADHVGPISLGFKHEPRFAVACATCNSGKGNRMRLEDVRTLLQWEAQSGESQASWQVRCLWDSLKNTIDSDEAALRLSRLMRINQHHYLSTLAHVDHRGAVDAIYGLLNLDFAENRYEFEDLNRATLEYSRLVVSTRQETYSRQKSARALRVSFDSLREYAVGGQRNIHAIPEEELEPAATSLNKQVNRLLLTPSAFRESLLVALDGHGEERDRRLAPVISDGPDASEPLAAARGAVLDALREYMGQVCEVLTRRYAAGTHMAPDALTRARVRGAKSV